LRTERIESRVDTLALFVRRGSQDIPVATLVRTIASTRTRGQPAWLFVQDYRTERGGNVDSSMVVASTLAPVWYASHAHAVEHFDFDGAAVHGTVAVGDSATRAVDTSSDEPAFNGVTGELVLSALPLAADFSAINRAYNPPRGFASARVRVTGAEALETASGVVDAWIVDFWAEGAPTTIWVGKRDHRTLRLRSQLTDGSVFWKTSAADKAMIR